MDAGKSLMQNLSFISLRCRASIIPNRARANLVEMTLYSIIMSDALRPTKGVNTIHEMEAPFDLSTFRLQYWGARVPKGGNADTGLMD